MTTLLPLDADDNTIPALRFKSGGAQSISVTDTSARNTTAFDESTKVIGLYATGPVYLAFGDSTITATASDHYFPSGFYYDVAIAAGGGKGANFTHVAVLRADQNCTLYLSEKN